MASGPSSEMVGASSKKLTLTGSAQSTTFTIQEPKGPAKARGKAKAAKAAKAAPLGKIYLHIENVVSKQSHATYEVYVDLPENPDEAAYQSHYAGTMHLFGVRHASRRSAQHAGSGLNFSMDITELVESLKEKNAWDENNVRVTFAPRAKEGEAHAAIAEHDPIKIGSVRLYRV